MLLKKEDALQEVRAIDKLFKTGIHENLVAVIAHGTILESPFYFIDMELCQGNLEDFLQGRHPETFRLSANPHFFGLEFEADARWIGTAWDIVEQITSGIQFIHGCGEVHRDLKPRNGATP